MSKLCFHLCSVWILFCCTGVCQFHEQICHPVMKSQGQSEKLAYKFSQFVDMAERYLTNLLARDNLQAAFQRNRGAMQLEFSFSSRAKFRHLKELLKGQITGSKLHIHSTQNKMILQISHTPNFRPKIRPKGCSLYQSVYGNRAVV